MIGWARERSRVSTSVPICGAFLESHDQEEMMAGSYRHVTDTRGRYRGLDLIEHMADAREALEECVGIAVVFKAPDALTERALEIVSGMSPARGELAVLFESLTTYIREQGTRARIAGAYRVWIFAKNPMVPLITTREFWKRSSR